MECITATEGHYPNFCTDRRRACCHGRGGVPRGMLSVRGRGDVTASSRMEAVRNAPLVYAATPRALANPRGTQEVSMPTHPWQPRRTPPRPGTAPPHVPE